jgi:hypothetical protein
MANQTSCSKNLDSDECLDYCLKNKNECSEIVKNYCFSIIDPINSNVFTSENCQLLIKEMISTQLVSPIDNILNNFCMNQLQVDSTNIDDYLQNGTLKSQQIKELCACFMDQNVYLNYYNSLVEKYPSIIEKGIGVKCLYPICAYGNQYKSNDIKEACPELNCINYVKITGSGTIDQLNLVQNERCFNYIEEVKNCYLDTDCSSDQLCVRNICYDKSTFGKVCINNSSCESGDKCYRNKCKPNNYCEGNMDCDLDQKCIKNTCSKIDICETDQDCFLNYKCINEKCINPEEIKNRLTIQIGTGIIIAIIVLILIVMIVIIIKK